MLPSLKLFRSESHGTLTSSRVTHEEKRLCFWQEVSRVGVGNVGTEKKKRRQGNSNSRLEEKEKQKQKETSSRRSENRS